jgi:hypothetical protein
LPYPAFSGFDPSQFLVRHEVHHDNLDFGPAFGLASSQSARSGWLGRLFGNGKTVWRGGYQISYDAFFTQLMTSAGTSTPNAISTRVPAPNTGRGAANWLEQLPTSAAAPSLADAQKALDPNLRNPYSERWSLAFERQLPLFDVFLRRFRESLHNNAGGCKTPVEPNDNQFWRPSGLDLGGLSCKTIRTKRKIGASLLDAELFSQWTIYIRIGRIKTTSRQSASD